MEIRLEAVVATVLDLPAELPLGRGNSESGGAAPQPLSFDVRTPPGVDFVVEADAGQNASGGQRFMRREGSDDLLPYALFNPSGTREVGGNTGDAPFMNGQPLGPFVGGQNQVVRFTAQNFPRGVRPGRYSDVITVTLVTTE